MRGAGSNPGARTGLYRAGGSSRQAAASPHAWRANAWADRPHWRRPSRRPAPHLARGQRGTPSRGRCSPGAGSAPGGGVEAQADRHRTGPADITKALRDRQPGVASTTGTIAGTSPRRRPPRRARRRSCCMSAVRRPATTPSRVGRLPAKCPAAQCDHLGKRLVRARQAAEHVMPVTTLTLDDLVEIGIPREPRAGRDHHRVT